MGGPAADLRRIVLAAGATLRGREEAWAAAPAAVGKWSPKQLIGHLIDSASNNHQRFVRAQFRTDLVFDGYEQDAWIAVQGYDEAPWLELLDLWVSFNLHLARVMQAAPAEVLRAPRSRHNLDRIAFEAVRADEPVSLEYFMRDYVAHLQHHLHQLDAGLSPAPGRQRPDGER